ncbi:hypothetical protein [Chitinophaga sp. YR573]|uniref:hypothetical protein n=1 Tax=Chitinophaga sp. YR573 TaxID=1881040 RepID=UPI000B7DBEC1|nr:hypothetical protein [Chitinophaga sp. YR573]
MKQFLLLCLALMVALFSFCQKRDKLLLKAYRSNSPGKMEHFFDTWKKNTSLSSADIKTMNDTVRNIYQVFQEFYTPLKTEGIGSYEWGQSFHYAGAKYLLLQDNINFGVVDVLNKDTLIQVNLGRLAKRLNITTDSAIRAYKADARFILKRFHFEWPTPPIYTTITKFRPQVSFSTPKTVTLTEQYAALLRAFLRNNHTKPGAKNIAATQEERDKRYAFLENYFKVWNGNWELYSPPYVTSITFDKNLENAVVNYHVVSSGGYAYLKKINGNWTLIEAERTWVH